MAERAFGPSYFAIITGPVLDKQELADSAKILYGRITSLADREGYCWASNSYLAQISRCGERTISRLLAQLETYGFIETEMVPNGKKGGQERRIYIGNRAAQCVDKIGEGSQFCRGGVAKNGEAYFNDDKEKRYIPPISPSAMFERFWAAYPKKKDKDRARKAWAKLAPDMTLCRTMSAALAAQKKTEEWTKEGGRYVPYPATWLNGKRWEDEDVAPPAPEDESDERRGRFL